MRYANEGPRWADDSHFSVNERYRLISPVVLDSHYNLDLHNPLRSG